MTEGDRLLSHVLNIVEMFKRELGSEKRGKSCWVVGHPLNIIGNRTKGLPERGGAGADRKI